MAFHHRLCREVDGAFITSQIGLWNTVLRPQVENCAIAILLFEPHVQYFDKRLELGSMRTDTSMGEVMDVLRRTGYSAGARAFFSLTKSVVVQLPFIRTKNLCDLRCRR